MAALSRLSAPHYFACARTASSTLWKTRSFGRASWSPKRSNAFCVRIDSSRATATVTPCSLHTLKTFSRTCAAVKSISTMPLASSTTSFGAEALRTSATSLANAAESRIRNVLQQAGSEREQRQHDCSRGEARQLRLAAGLGHDARPWRAGVDGKRTEHAGEEAPGARAQKIAIDIGGLIRIGGERSRGRGGLHHDHDGDREGERDEVYPLLGCKLRQCRHWQRAGHRADHLHAFAFETGADDRQCRGDPSDQRARKFCAHHLGDTYRRQ